MTESAHDEALRLIVKVCDLPVHKIMDFETGNYPLSLEQVERLIALARQRPGWVWVPEKPTEDMQSAGVNGWDQGLLRANQLMNRISLAWWCWQAMLAAAPKPGEWE
jgi:hypothetical protein